MARAVAAVLVLVLFAGGCSAESTTIGDDTVTEVVDAEAEESGPDTQALALDPEFARQVAEIDELALAQFGDPETVAMAYLMAYDAGYSFDQIEAGIRSGALNADGAIDGIQAGAEPSSRDWDEDQVRLGLRVRERGPDADASEAGTLVMIAVLSGVSADRIIEAILVGDLAGMAVRAWCLTAVEEVNRGECLGSLPPAIVEPFPTEEEPAAGSQLSGEDQAWITYVVDDTANELERAGASNDDIIAGKAATRSCLTGALEQGNDRSAALHDCEADVNSYVPSGTEEAAPEGEPDTGEPAELPPGVGTFNGTYLGDQLIRDPGAIVEILDTEVIVDVLGGNVQGLVVVTTISESSTVYESGGEQIKTQQSTMTMTFTGSIDDWGRFEGSGLTGVVYVLLSCRGEPETVCLGATATKSARPEGVEFAASGSIVDGLFTIETVNSVSSARATIEARLE